MIPHNQCVVARPGELYRVPGGLVRTSHGVLSPEDAQLVSQITACAPLEDHVLALSRRFGLDESGQEDLGLRVRGLLEQGYLIDSRDFVQASWAADSGVKIGVSAILTHQRPAALARVVRDFGMAALAAGRELVVSDDSASPAKLPVHINAAVHWIDRSHRADWWSLLGGGHLADAAHWALLPDKSSGRNTVGSSVNTSMLHAAGQGLSLFDDDICAPLGRGLGSEPQYWTVGAPVEPTQIQLFDHMEGAIGSMEPVEGDPGALLEEGLGARVSALSRLDMLNIERGLDQRSVRALQRDGQILTTMLGVAGDNGMASPRSYLSLREDDGRRLDERFQVRVLSRNVQRASSCNRLSQSRMFMNACVGLDLRQPLPPFHPSGRNSDALFGAVLQKLEPDAFRLYRPYMITHRPVDQRRYTVKEFSETAALRSPMDSLIELVSSWSPPPMLSDRLQRMQELGRYLESFGGLSPAQFSDWLAESSFFNLSSQINEWEILLDRVAKVRHSLLRSCIEGAERALKQLKDRPLETLLPRDIGIDDYQVEISEYGRLLQVWPELVSFSRHTPLQGEERVV